ncbi:hypothetical protein VE02_04455 [Pseudogymnoascus sp. 03VT05]|nr:hypothetical protein VE02_04455 [Pseudogymnoascus sp. 03VT05]
MSLFRPGDMLKEHQSASKKQPGMFGNLAICLSSKHEGGDLIVTHDGRFKVLSTAPQSAFGYSYLFWYTGLIVELTEVTLGNRLVLTYNLIDISHENVPDVPTSFWQKMDLLESAFLFWKSSYTKQASCCPKFLAYTLDNMYDEHSLSCVALQGDDYQRVNALLQLCKRHRLILYLAKLRLQVERETSGQVEELLELQHVVQLDGTKVFDVAPFSASDIVQNTFSDSLDSREVSGSIGNNGANGNQVYHRFAVVLMPAESYIDFYFESAKLSATDMGDWICKLTAACIASDGNDCEG